MGAPVASLMPTARWVPTSSATTGPASAKFLTHECGAPFRHHALHGGAQDARVLGVQLRDDTRLAGRADEVHVAMCVLVERGATHEDLDRELPLVQHRDVGRSQQRRVADRVVEDHVRDRRPLGDVSGFGHRRFRALVRILIDEGADGRRAAREGGAGCRGEVVGAIEAARRPNRREVHVRIDATRQDQPPRGVDHASALCGRQVRPDLHDRAVTDAQIPLRASDRRHDEPVSDDELGRLLGHRLAREGEREAADDPLCSAQPSPRPNPHRWTPCEHELVLVRGHLSRERRVVSLPGATRPGAGSERSCAPCAGPPQSAHRGSRNRTRQDILATSDSSQLPCDDIGVVMS